MPFTPLHLGPGVLVKAIAPRTFSFSAFAATQVLIDVEPLYNILRSAWPLHAVMHSLVLSTGIGLLVGLAVPFASPLLEHLPVGWRSHLKAETSVSATLLGGLLGGVSHPLLDALMHQDLKPFWPFSDANPLLGAVDLMTLHVACLGAGLLGLLILWLRNHRSAKSD